MLKPAVLQLIDAPGSSAAQIYCAHLQPETLVFSHSRRKLAILGDCQHCQNRRNCQNCEARKIPQSPDCPILAITNLQLSLSLPFMTLIGRVCAFAIFLGSCLLFLLEPMVAKRLVPLLGGSSAVWVTCLVFFQTALLLGYLLAHCLGTYLPARAHALVYTEWPPLGHPVMGYSLTPKVRADRRHPLCGGYRAL